MRKNHDRMQSHKMELPRLIEIGEKNINDFGKFLLSLNKQKKVSLIAGTNVQKILKKKIEKSLKLKDWLPSQFFNEFQDSKVRDYLEWDIVCEFIASDSRHVKHEFKHKNVFNWWWLANGKCVGWNENPATGWSFPVEMVKNEIYNT